MSDRERTDDEIAALVPATRTKRYGARGPKASQLLPPTDAVQADEPARPNPPPDPPPPVASP